MTHRFVTVNKYMYGVAEKIVSFYTTLLKNRPVTNI